MDGDDFVFMGANGASDVAAVDASEFECKLLRNKIRSSPARELSHVPYHNSERCASRL